MRSASGEGNGFVLEGLYKSPVQRRDDYTGNRAGLRTAVESDKARPVEFQTLEGRLEHRWAQALQDLYLRIGPSLGIAVGCSQFNRGADEAFRTHQRDT